MSKAAETIATARPRGRPRDARRQQRILQAALDDFSELGFRAVSMESIAARAGVAKTTLYLRWPNKAAVVMDAFLSGIGPGIGFPRNASAVERIRLQMRALTRAFRGKYGTMVKALLGEAQFDAELAQAFRERWIAPRRQTASIVFRVAIATGELRADSDIETAIDALYGGIYYRLMIGTGALSEDFIEALFAQVMEGLRNAGHQ
jgi:AcrR family transcriptional regulator